MKVYKTIERDGRTYEIGQVPGGHFQIVDEAGTVLDEFQLMNTTDGWGSFRSKFNTDPSVETWATSFAAEVQAGKIKID